MRFRFVLLSAAMMAPLFAQAVMAPGNEQAGNPRGDNYGDYNITSSFETGYRFYTVNGNSSKYRSDVNFRNGLRLLGGNLAAYSKDGHGHYFDELLINVQGLGNDPYQFSSLRISKNGLYRYDMIWRENDYFNPALTIAGGQHFLNTAHRLQDHSLTLFPQSSFLKIFLGYSRNVQDGPALTTIQLFDSRGDEFPLFSNIRRQQNEYRLGAEVTLAGNRINFLRSWEYFKEDTTESGVALQAGDNPNDTTTLTSFQRSQPYHGNTNSWRVNWVNDRSRYLQMNGRFAYAGGRRNFVFDENAIGTGRFGAANQLQTYVLGNARRPVTAANLTLSAFPSKRLTFVNHTGYHNTRIDGDGSFTQINIANLNTTQFNFEFLGIRTLTNQTDLNYRASDALSLYSGYQFSNRKIRSVQQSTFFGTADRSAAEQENTLHAGTFGLRLRPIKPLSVNLDAEIGRADNPFFPIAEKNYHALNGRVQYKAKSWTLTAFAKTNYNTNSVSLSAFASRSRTYSADLSWAPKEWFSVDAGYNKMHLDTAGGISYFVLGDLLNGTSRYISNIHAGNLQVRFRMNRRTELFVGYSRVQDTGDGRSTVVRNTNDVANLAFYLAQTFPLTYESPMTRISVKILPKLRWNAGYQYYHYREGFKSLQNYRAHTGFTSLTWAF